MPYLLTIFCSIPLLFAILYPIVNRSLTGESTYCYTRIDSFGGDSGNDQFECLTVHRNGTFGKIFTPGAEEGFEKVDGYVLPGFWDGHAHLLGYGEMLGSVKLYGVENIDDVKARIKEYLKTHPKAGTRENWIRGIGWDQANFNSIMPTAADLSSDPELAGLYIMLDRVDVHCKWFSQPILDLLPNPLPPSPAGGYIVTSPGPGVFCDNAMDLPLEFWTRPGSGEKMKYLEDAITSLHQVGIVGVHDAGIRMEDVEIMEWMAEMGILNLRVYAMLECPEINTFCLSDVRKIGRPDAMVTVRSVKLYGDGALGSHGAALLEPYSDDPTTSGTMMINETALATLVSQWYSADFQVNIHAIGDRANRAAVSAIHASLREHCLSLPRALPGNPAWIKTCMRAMQKTRRHRIEHAQIMHPDDQEVVFTLGIGTSIQPTHATSDMAYAVDRLGEDRLRHSAYKMKTFAEKNPSPLILGSDFPVEPPSPLAGVYAAYSRLDPNAALSEDGSLPESTSGWYMEEALTRDQAMRGFLQGPAWGAFMSGLVGVIQQGAWADWVVVDGDWKVGDVRRLKVKETWVGGKRVWKARADEKITGWRGWVQRILDTGKVRTKEETVESE
ncbi:hypothetical protein RUND412_004953 [Rhizina undulata]